MKPLVVDSDAGMRMVPRVIWKEPAPYLVESAIEQFHQLERYSQVAVDSMQRLNDAMRAYCEGDVTLVDAMRTYQLSSYNNLNPLTRYLQEMRNADDLPVRLERDFKACRLANQGDRTAEQLRRRCGVNCSYLPLWMAAGLDARL